MSDSTVLNVPRRHLRSCPKSDKSAQTIQRLACIKSQTMPAYRVTLGTLKTLDPFLQVPRFLSQKGKPGDQATVPPMRQDFPAQLLLREDFDSQASNGGSGVLRIHRMTGDVVDEMWSEVAWCFGCCAVIPASCSEHNNRTHGEVTLKRGRT